MKKLPKRQLELASFRRYFQTVREQILSKYADGDFQKIYKTFRAERIMNNLHGVRVLKLNFVYNITRWRKKERKKREEQEETRPGSKKNLPAFINKQKDHKTEKTTESRCDSDPGHNIVSFVKFNFELLPLAECRRRFRQECRRVHPPRRYVAYVHVAAYDTPHIYTKQAYPYFFTLN